MYKDPIPVTVVIPAKNAVMWLPEQLDALVSQDAAPPFEVVVSDNGSQDDLPSVIAQYADQLQIRVVDASEHPGASFARNVGAADAQGEVLLFCDADDIVNDRWVREVFDVVSQARGILAAGVLLHEKFNSPAVLAAYGISPDADAFRDEGEPPQRFAGYLPTVAGGNFGIRRADYLALRGMDSSYPGGSEETDFAWRAQAAGLRVVTVPRATIQYRLKSDARSLYRQQRVQQRARMLLWRRYADRGMTGPSWKSSLTTILLEISRLTRARTPEARLLHARVLGGHVGAIEGMLRYRLLRRAPSVSLGTFDSDPRD